MTTDPGMFQVPRMPAPGTVLAGKYRVERQIGSGGMGVVLSAQHIELEIAVAVKLLSASASIDPDHLIRFKREAKAAANIKNERVVRILDYGTLEDGTPFIVMEQLEGASLVDILESGERISIADACDYIIQACEGLNEAHRLGVIHRDIKPGNLFVVKRIGAPLLKVLDFGAAKLAPNSLLARDGGSSTQPTSLIGSPRYMAPEQLKESHAIDHRVDVYALGASLYELLSGQPIFEGDTIAAIFSRVLYEPPPALSIFRPDVPPELEIVVMKCLQKRADDRYQSVVELARALQPFAHERSAAVVAGLTPHEVTSHRPPARASMVSAPAQSERMMRASSSARTVHLKPRPMRYLVATAVVAALAGGALAIARARSNPRSEVREPVQVTAPASAAPKVERVAEPPPLPPAPDTSSPATAPTPPERVVTKGTSKTPARTSATPPPSPPNPQTSPSPRPAASGKGGEFDQFGGRL